MNSAVDLLRSIAANPLVDSRVQSEAGWLARLISSPRLGPALRSEFGGDWRDWLWG